MDHEPKNLALQSVTNEGKTTSVKNTTSTDKAGTAVETKKSATATSLMAAPSKSAKLTERPETRSAGSRLVATEAKSLGITKKKKKTAMSMPKMLAKMSVRVATKDARNTSRKVVMPHHRNTTAESKSLLSAQKAVERPKRKTTKK